MALRRCAEHHCGRHHVYRTVCLGVLVLIALTALITKAADAAPPFAPIYHLYEPELYVQPVSGPFRDAQSQALHVYMPCAAAPAAPVATGWCHATSTDYVTWARTAHNVAALNASAWYDRGGVTAGTFMLNALDEPTVIYTCVDETGARRQCLASPSTADVRSARAFTQLRKCPLNPVITHEDVPDLADRSEFRDPTAWWESPAVAGAEDADADAEAAWLVAFSAPLVDETHGVRPHVIVFATTDPSFESGYGYSHSLYTDDASVDTMFAYPDFFVAGDPANMASPDVPHLLKLSSITAHRDYILQGSYASPSADSPAVFSASDAAGEAWLDLGELYGAKTFWDPVLRRRRVWGWVDEDMADETSLGWGGLQTVRELSYDNASQTVRFPPIAEWKALREAALFSGTVPLTETGVAVQAMNNTAGATRYHEIIADFSFPAGYLENVGQYYTEDTAPELGLRLRANADATQYVSLSLRMPVANATAARCYTQYRYPFRVFTLPDVANDTALCRAACEETALCMAWDRVTRVYENVCALYWQSSEPLRNCSATTGRPNEPILALSRAQSGTRGATTVLEGRAPLSPDTPNSMQLHVYVDDSVIEVFKDGGKECLTGRVYLDDDAQQGIWVYAKNMPVEQVNISLRVFRMGSIWQTATLHGAVEGYANGTYQLLSALIPDV